MNEEYFEQVRNLCKACGLAIYKIAKQFNIKQNLVAKFIYGNYADNFKRG